MYEWCLESAQRADESERDFKLIFKECKEYKIGRTIGFDIVSSNLLVSRNHGIITLKPDGHIYIRDLKSFNGIYINDKRIESLKDILLQNDDLLGIGAPSSVHVQKTDLFWVRRKRVQLNLAEYPEIEERQNVLEVLQVENNLPSTSNKCQKSVVERKSSFINISDKKKSDEICRTSKVEDRNKDIKIDNSNNGVINGEMSSKHLKDITKDISNKNKFNFKNSLTGNGSVNCVKENETKITNKCEENNVEKELNKINFKNSLTGNGSVNCVKENETKITNKCEENNVEKELNKFNFKSSLTGNGSVNCVKENETKITNKCEENNVENELNEICPKKENNSNLKINKAAEEKSPVLQNLSYNYASTSGINDNKEVKPTEEIPTNLELYNNSSNIDINEYQINEDILYELDDSIIEIEETEIKCDLKNHSFTQNDEDDIVIISDDEDIFPRSQLFELKEEPQNFHDMHLDLNIKDEVQDYDDYNEEDVSDDDDLSCKWYMKLSQSQDFKKEKVKIEIEEPQDNFFPTFDDKDLPIEDYVSFREETKKQDNEDYFLPEIGLETNKESVAEKENYVSSKEDLEINKEALAEKENDVSSKHNLECEDIFIPKEDLRPNKEKKNKYLVEDTVDNAGESSVSNKKQTDLCPIEKVKNLKSCRVVLEDIENKEKEAEQIVEEASKNKSTDKISESSKLPDPNETVSKHLTKEKKKWYTKPPVIEAPHLVKGKRKASEDLKIETSSSGKKKKPLVESASSSSTSLTTAQGSSIHIDKSVRTELDKRKKGRKKSVEIYTKDTKLKIQEDRKKKLKEIASKKSTSETDINTKEHKDKPHTKPKVKVSSSRGLFLTEDEKNKEEKREKTKDSMSKKKTESHEPKKEKTKETSVKKKSYTSEIESGKEKSKENLKKKASTHLEEEPATKKKHKNSKKVYEPKSVGPIRKLSFNDLNSVNADNKESSSKVTNFPEKTKALPNQSSRKDYPEKRPSISNDNKVSQQNVSEEVRIPKVKSPNFESTRKEHRTVSEVKKPKEILLSPYFKRNIKKQVRIIPEPQIKYIERSPGNNCRKVNSKDAPIPNIIKSKSENEILSVVLSWKPAWLEEQKHMPNSPQLSKRNPMRMLTNFNSVGDYVDIVTPLMLLELWSNIFRDWCFNNSQIKFAHILHVGRKADGLLQLSGYCLAEKDDTNSYPRCGDLLIVEYYFEVDSKVATTKKFGFVSNSNKRRMTPTEQVHKQFHDYGRVSPFKIEFTLLINCPTNIKIILEKLIRIRLVSRINCSLRLFKPVSSLKHSPLSNLILKPNIQQFKVIKPTQMTSATEDDLNTDQMMCIYEAYQICTRKEAGIYMIQGPPGTGKSFVIKNLVRQLLCDPSKNTNVQKHRILLCAPSNGAIDEITNTLLEMRSSLPKNNRFKMIRLGPPNSILNPIVRSISVPELVSKYILTQQNNNLKSNHLINDELNFLTEKRNTIKNVLMSLQQRKQECSAELLNLKRVQEQISLLSTNNCTYQNRRLLEREAEVNYLANADIICTTLSSCVGSKLEEMVKEKKIEFTCCVIDEATQSNEQETLIPLLLNINKFVLVGDPEQLPPTTLSKEAKHLGHGHSLFSRLQRCFNHLKDNPIRMLTHQYRMHPEICKFPSVAFYGGKLKSAELVTQRNENILDPCSLFCLNNTIDYKETEYQNKVEGDLVLVLTDLITKKTKYNIGIITPYTKQKDYLINKLRTMRSKDKENIEEDRNTSRVVINTVDGFQGQERDVIIISAVRNTSNIFLNDTQRLNVALTRAKHAVYICAHVNLFKTESIWQKLECEAKSRNFFYLLTEEDVINERYLSKLLFRQ